MAWFKSKEKKLEMIQAIRPTSKATLKMQCLMVCKGNIDESTKLYDYFAKDMPELPDYDQPTPTWMDNTKDTVNGLMGWIGENKDTLAQAYDFIRQVVQKRALPTIGEPTGTAAPLPPINE